MDKNSLVNIDLQPIADVANNIIDKISNVVGWLSLPKGEKVNKIEAEKYFIEKIGEDENIPLLAKTAMMSHSRKIIREYCNQNDILSIALTQLSNTAGSKSISDDWISTFFDMCKNVNSQELKVIWGKILAGELNNPGCVPVKLLRVLSEMNKDDANAFRTLCKFSLIDKKDNSRILFIYGYPIPLEFYIANGLTANIISKMEELQLIKGFELSRFADKLEKREKKTYQYHKKEVYVIQQNDEYEIDLGNISFTEAGVLLADIIMPIEVKKFPEYVAELLRDDDLYVEVKNICVH